MIRHAGEVFLVGAGPGDPELITLKAWRLLKSADVIIHDRLIGPELLSECRQDTEQIDVGKYPDHHRICQQQINALLVSKAQSGKRVVRLKGGDPFVFGRGMEEWDACRSAGIKCTVVPGISSSIAGPAAAGIPITTRGVARSFAVVTGQTDPRLPEHQLDFAALSQIDTVVFMMGRKNLKHLASSLMAAGRAANTPATCIQDATLPSQRTVTGCLATIHAVVQERGLTSPVITVVGDVAALVDRRFLDQPLSVERDTAERRCGQWLSATARPAHDDVCDDDVWAGDLEEGTR